MLFICTLSVLVHENKIEIVPNGINFSEYVNLPEKGKFRKKHSILTDEKLILYLGRIHRVKGIDLLINAFSDLIKELDDVKLVIVGPDDGFLPTLKKQVEDLNICDKVLFTAPIYEEDKLKAYIDADVYVLPSIYETFPNTVLESCACGTPVIVTDRCGIADYVDAHLGHVVEYDKNQLKNAIYEILTNEELLKVFEENCRKSVVEGFNWNNIVKKIENTYQKCLSPNKWGS